jgi:transposase
LVALPSPSPTTTSNTESTTSERRGPVLDMLRELLAEGRNDDVLALVRQLVARNSELERRLAQMLARGRKNEGVSSAQLRLLLEQLTPEAQGALGDADDKLRTASGIDAPAPNDGDSSESTPPQTEPQRKQPALRRPIPARLRRIDNPISVPEAERPCPVCGKERACIGHDVTEVIDLIPAEVVVRVDRREKLACADCESELIRAPQGDKVVSGGRLGSTLVANLLVEKYRDGLPLHRQKERFERLGLSLPVSTLGDQVTWSTDLLRPLWRAALGGVLNTKVMHLDGTGLVVLDRDAAGGKKLGTLWGYVGDRDLAAVLYASTGKKVGQQPGELGPEDVLALRRGYVVADASNLFEASFQRDDLIECGCNMHARRYFVEALDRGDVRAALPIAAFKKIYQVEEQSCGLDADGKRAARQAESKPVYDELCAWCEAHQPHEPPSSPLGTAIRYLLNHRAALRRFLDDGVIPIDNGIVERLHVRTALTRKNFLFAGSDAGGERAAIAFTILGCCKLADVNPVEYLADVLPRMARRIRLRDIPDLLPARWKERRPPQSV